MQMTDRFNWMKGASCSADPDNFEHQPTNVPTREQCREECKKKIIDDELGWNDNLCCFHLKGGDCHMRPESVVFNSASDYDISAIIMSENYQPINYNIEPEPEDDT